MSSTKLVHELFGLKEGNRGLKPCWLAGTVSLFNRSQEATGLIGSTFDDRPESTLTGSYFRVISPIV